LVFERIKQVREEFAFIQGNLLVLIMSSMFFRFSFHVSGTFRSLYLRELGASPFMLGVMDAVASVMMIVIRIPGAYIADRFGRVKLIGVFSFVWVASFLAIALAPDWRWALLGIMISNLSELYTPAREALEADSIPANRRGMGFVSLWTIPSIITLIAPGLAGYLVDRYDLLLGNRIVFVIAATSAAVASSIRILYLKETLQDPEKFNWREIGSVFRESIRSLLEVPRLVSAELRVLILVFMITSVQDSINRTYSSLYVYDVIGVQGFEYSMASTAWLIASLLAAFPAGKTIEKIGKRKSIILAYCVSLPLDLLWINIRGYTPLLMINTIYGASFSLFSAYHALQADLVPRETRGRILGTIGIIRVLIMMFSAPIGGLLYEYKPVYPFLLNILMTVFIVTIFVFKIKEPIASSDITLT
jgi:MFS family permease